MARISLLLGLSAVFTTFAAGRDRFGFDCESGYKHWRQAWPVEKKKWCCDYVQRGCIGDNHHRDLFDCGDSLNTWRKAWSDEKKDWCCINKQPWSLSHQNFCCERGKGCQRGPQGPPFNCRTGTFTPEKRKWCCQNDPPHGCVPQTTTKLFDCQAGLINWKTGWSKRKQVWCCSNENLGCPVQDPIPPLQGAGDGRYHCRRGFATKAQWPKERICYCCNHFGIACPPVYYPPNIPPPNVVICHGEIAAFDGTVPEIAPPSESSPAGVIGAACLLGCVALIGLVTLVRRGLFSRHDFLKVSTSEQSIPLTPAADEEALSKAGKLEVEMEVH